MKKNLLFLALFCGITPSLIAQSLHQCGNTDLLERIARADPAFAARRKQILAQDQQQALQMSQNTAAKGTAQHPIPVAFHVLVSNAQYQQMGGDTGIIRRVNSQLAVLNADYSATNADINQVPAPFRPLAGNSGLQFRLASGTSSSTIAPGIELKLTSNLFDDNSGYADAKRASQGGLDGWDPTRNLNIWVVSASNGTLGVAVPPSILGASFPGGRITTADLGVAVSYSALGKREFPRQYFYPGTNDKGRTLTHEIGHYFELEHVFGDDAGCGLDDGIADTPPQAGPTYSGSTRLAFPLYDACSPSGNGIMYMNYMDYVDDGDMMFFTKQQVARMQFYTSAGQESYSLTQQPMGVADPQPESRLVSVFPNPSSGIFRILNGSNLPLTALQVADMTGRTVFRAADVPARESQTITLPAVANGLYFLKGNLGSETFTQKIVLQ